MVEALVNDQDLFYVPVLDLVRELEIKKVEEAKAKMGFVKNYAKKHKYLRCIKDVKTRVYSKMYGMRFNLY